MNILCLYARGLTWVFVLSVTFSQTPSFGQNLKELKGHKTRVYSIAFSPDGGLLASGSIDGTIILWDTKSWGIHRKIKIRAVSALAFSIDGTMLAVASYDDIAKRFPIVILDTNTWKVSKTIAGHKSIVMSLAFSSNNLTIASGSGDNTIKLWNIKSNKMTRHFKGHPDEIMSLEYSPDGKILASCGDANTIKLWNTKTGKCIRTHNVSHPCIAFLPDSHAYAIGSNATVDIMNTKTGRLIQQYKQPNYGRISNLSYSQDTRTLAMCGIRGAQRTAVNWSFALWDTKIKKETRSFTARNQIVVRFTFSPDGKSLAWCSLDLGNRNVVTVWQIKK